MTDERLKEYVFIGNAQNKTRDFINKITKDNKEYKTQQQEFIKYLKQCVGNEEYCYMAEKREDRIRKDIFEEILQKYREIIGDDK